MASRERLIRMLQQMVDSGATELHFKVPSTPLMRVDGQLVPVKSGPLRPAEVQEALQHLLGLANKEVPLAQLQDLTFAFGVPGMGRFQAVVYRQRGTLAIIVRRVRTTPPTLASLGVGAEFAAVLGRPGLLLVAGPNRSDLLHALVSAYNEQRRCLVTFVEPTLSYLHRDALATIAQREVGVDVASTAEGIRAATTTSTDLLAIGDLDTPDAVEMALTAAEGGLSILAGVGAPSAQLATSWLTRMFSGDRRLVVEERLAATFLSAMGLSRSGEMELAAAPRG